MPMPRMITTKELKEAALKYYNDKQLTAQGNKICVLLDARDKRRCVIGAAMTEDEIAKARITTVSALVLAHIVQFEDPDFASKLQNIHDSWCCCTTATSCLIAEDNFVSLLN